MTYMAQARKLKTARQDVSGDQDPHVAVDEGGERLLSTLLIEVRVHGRGGESVEFVEDEDDLLRVLLRAHEYECARYLRLCCSSG